MKKTIKRVLGTGIVFGITIGLLYGGYSRFVNPGRDVVSSMKESLEVNDTMTQKEAQEDLTYLMEKLKKFHPAWSDDTKGITKRVESQYQIELVSLNDSMTMLEVWQAASRIVHEMEDAHTRVSTSRLDGEGRYRIDTEGITVDDIIEVNGEAITDIRDRFLALWPYELLSYGIGRFEKYIVYQEYLELAGIDTSYGVDITYLSGKEEITKHFEAEVYDSPSSEFVSYQIDNENNLGIFTLTACKDNRRYDEALAEFFEQVDSNHITNVAVDLRENNGGWIPAVKEFLEYVNVDNYIYCNNLRTRMGRFWYNENEIIQNKKKDTVYSGNLYVLTSSKTFSSAMDFAMVIMDNDIGTIVGDIPGNLPDSYTINFKYQLPNTGLKLVVSSAEQNRIDESKRGEPLIPDYEVEAEQAMEKVYELILDKQ